MKSTENGCDSLALASFETIVILGHRGTGKSSFVGRVARFFPDHEIIDLDREIEKRKGQSIQDIFTQHGEAYFRRIEIEIFNQNCNGKKVIAVGAGFQGEIAKSALVIWLRRESDALGRVFVDRPRLNPELSDLVEYHERVKQRSPRFESMANLVLTLREGETDFVENLFFSQEFENCGIFTLQPRHLDSLQNLEIFRPKYYEVRDDLLTEKQIDQVVNFFGFAKVIYSHRKGQPISYWQKFALRDWPIEMGTCQAPSSWEILSCHDHSRVGEFDSLSRRHRFAKLAIPIEDFRQLEKFDDWAEKDRSRSFLPISPQVSSQGGEPDSFSHSPSARWSWYRLLNKNRNFLNFFSDGLGPVGDQPYFMQWLSVPGKMAGFAAILGDPVCHSRTPVEQGDFFWEKNLAVLPISLPEREWENAIKFLQKKGLRAAAVTSPLKKLAFQNIELFHGDSDLLSANTMQFADQISGTNTDIDALRVLFGGLDEVAVWGGGGLLESLKSAVPDADFFSARSGQIRGQGRAKNSYSHLIWAAGNRSEKTPDFEFAKIWDLSYSKDSMALQLAKAREVPYSSGLKMFQLQAEAQRRFWQPFYP